MFMHEMVRVNVVKKSFQCQIIDFIDYLQEKPVSEDLEEAASRYAKEEYSHKNPATLPDRCIGCYAPLIYAFKAGAEWKEEQMMKDTIKANEDFEIEQRMKECPYRQVGCTMYEGKILECRGACSWVVDYPKLKELKARERK